jgi:hypothetical protein
MDLSQIKSLGEIAGIGGIALGVVVLLLRPLIATISGLPKDARSGPVKMIAIGCFVIGALGIGAWIWGNQSKGLQASTRGTQSPAVIGGGNVTVNFGSPSVPQTGSSPVDSPASPLPSGAAAQTEGSQSPGVITGGKADIEYSPPPAATPSPPGAK